MAKRHSPKAAPESTPATKRPLDGILALVRRRAPLFIGIAYLAIMLPIALIYHRVGNYRLETDFFWSYAPQARLLLQDGVLPIEDFRGPVYPVMLAGFSLLLGDYFRAGIIISLLSAAVILGMLYALVSRLWNSGMALWAVALTALNPIFVRYSYEAGTDLIFAALSFSSIYLITRDRSIGGGFLAGVAYLTRFNGLALLAAGLFHRQRLWILAAFALMIFPWSTRCFLEKGDAFYNRNYLNIAYNVYAEDNGKPWDDFWADPTTHQRFTSLSSVILADPAKFTMKMLKNVYTHVKEDIRQVLGYPAGIVALLGLALLRPNRKQAHFFLFGLAMFGVNLLTFYADRFSIILIPFYAVLTVWACYRISELLVKLLRTKHAQTPAARAARGRPVC